MTIEPFETNGLVFSSPSQKRPFHVKLDGKQYDDQAQDPEAVRASTTIAKRINPHTLEVVNLLNGKPESTSEYRLSDDEKTLTIVTKAAKSGAVYTSVFDRN